jgi:4-amino-4-deoxy-L-arabinose transferase-like glycosyltransferase
MAEITKSALASDKATPTFVWVIVFVLGLAAYFVGLSIPFVGPDEPRYAQVAREMWQAGDWVGPTLGGHPWFEKPALLYWLEIASYNIFGVSEFAARLGPALFGLGTIGSLWLLGYSVSKTKGQRPKTAFANYLALIAASTLGLLIFAHGASFDIVVTFTMTAALVCFYIFDSEAQKNPGAIPTRRDSDSRSPYLALTLFYTFIGLSLLAKGLIGIVFPFAIVAFYYILSRRWPSGKFIFSLCWGTLLACYIASIWYVPMYIRHGWPFIDEFFIQHHLARFTSNKYQHPQPFYFFLWVLPVMLLPWTPFFLVAIWKDCKALLNRRDAETQSEVTVRSRSLSRPLALFAVSWLLVPLVFFSFSGSKLPGYILPAVPAAVVITSIYVFGLVQRSRKWAYAVLTIAALVFAVMIAASLTVVPRVADSETVKGLIHAAADQGHRSEPVYGLHTVSHSAEFYAADRLLREPGGSQKKLYSTDEIAAEMQRANVRNALVLVPLEYAPQLQTATMLQAEFIRDNGELAIYAVSLP